MSAMACPLSRKQTLLVATDGSEFSKNAIREAISLAKVCSSRLIALSVVKTNLEFESVLPQIVEKDERAAIRHLESVKRQAEREGLACETIVRLGEDPYEDIVSCASAEKADIIIVGTHGETGLRRLMMGSVTAKVIGHSPCSVLVVPLNARIECRHILMATDGSKYSQAAAAEAVGIARRCNASLTVLSVASSDEEIASARGNVETVIDAAEREGVKATSMVTEGKPHVAIVKTARRKRADLIVLGSHGRTGIERLLMGSVTERVIGHSKIAVLVVKT